MCIALLCHAFNNLYSGFEIHFYVLLPPGQPQDLVWLSMKYFGYEVNLLDQFNPRK